MRFFTSNPEIDHEIAVAETGEDAVGPFPDQVGLYHMAGERADMDELKDAYQAYDLKSEKFALSPELGEYELPSAPDLGSLIGQQNTPVELPPLPARPVEESEDGIPRAPDLD